MMSAGKKRSINELYQGCMAFFSGDSFTGKKITTQKDVKGFEFRVFTNFQVSKVNDKILNVL